MVGSTAACIVAANSIGLRRNAAIAGLYKLSESALSEYREKVVEFVGEDDEREIRRRISEDRGDNPRLEPGQVYVTGAGDVLCLDSLSGRYFKSSVEKIRKLVNDFNHDLLGGVYTTLNDWYDLIGLKHTVLGRTLGWDATGKLLDVTFGSTIAESGELCLVLEYRVGPEPVR